MNITASLIASLMRSNCRDYVAGKKSRAEWSAEQIRLWRQAGDERCAADVLRLVRP
jgi:hypothetical protein